MVCKAANALLLAHCALLTPLALCWFKTVAAHYAAFRATHTLVDSELGTTQVLTAFLLLPGAYDF